MQQDSSITADQAAAVCFSKGSPEALSEYFLGVLLPRGFIFALVSVVTLDDFRVRLPALAHQLLYCSVGYSTATIQCVEVFVSDLLREAILAPCGMALIVQPHRWRHKPHTGPRHPRIVQRMVDGES